MISKSRLAVSFGRINIGFLILNNRLAAVSL